jgi:LTXXQ motif family protein
MNRRISISIMAAAVVACLSPTAVLAESDGWFWGRGHMGEWFRGEMWRDGMMGNGPGHMMMGRRFNEHRLEALKAELAITSAQEDAWKVYVTAIESAGDAMRQTHMSMMDKSAPATLPERLAMQENFMTMHQDSMKSVREATLTLYAKLDETQKKKADELILGMGMM